MISSRGIEASLLRGKGITSYPLGMSISEQGEYNLMDCKRIVHEGFVYVKLNDLLHVKKKFEQ